MKMAIFLRGVNVNGVKIIMKDLKQTLENLGYQQVKTLLATGNVVLEGSDEQSLDQHKQAIENHLKEVFSYDAHIILLPMDTLGIIVSEGQVHQPKSHLQYYAILSNDVLLAKELGEIFDTLEPAPEEAFLINDHSAYWIVPKGLTLKTPFGKTVLGKKAYKSRLTTRTYATLQKTYLALEAMT